MKNLKEFRKGLNMTQSQLAEEMKTTQQTIARWERGECEPSIENLRLLALALGTNADALINNKPWTKLPAPSVHWYPILSNFKNGLLDGFWGHIGVKVQDKIMAWHPITLNTRNRIVEEICNTTSASDWVQFETLNNLSVWVRPQSVKQITFVSDDDEFPEQGTEDCVGGFSFYGGVPLDFSQAFEAIHSFYEYPGEEWTKRFNIVWDIFEDISKTNEELCCGKKVPSSHDTKRMAENTAILEQFVKDLTVVIKQEKEKDGEESTFPEKIIDCALSVFYNERLYDEDIYKKKMETTSLYYKDGSKKCILHGKNNGSMQNENIYFLLSYCNADHNEESGILTKGKVLYVPDQDPSCCDVTHFVPLDSLAMIEMPYHMWFESQELQDEENGINVFETN